MRKFASVAAWLPDIRTSGVPVRASGRRLEGVDGLRAFAALWVALFHVTVFSTVNFSRANIAGRLLLSGSTGVSLFLVLSGFCLFVPFAGGRADRFTAREFFTRRGNRLLPAYYTSLLLILVLYIGAGAWLGFERFSPVQLLWQVLTHATLTHSLFPSTFYALNGAYWSLALEWQLYLALPLLIWGIRRFGLKRTALCAIGVNVVYRLILAFVVWRGIIPGQSALATVVLPNLLPGRWAEFVFGMIAAELYASGRIASITRYAWTALLLGIPVSLVSTALPISHVLFGITYASLLCLVLSSTSIVARVFSWRPLVALGVMSYSIYLVHQPLVQGMSYVLQHQTGLSHTGILFALILLIPVVVAIAWLLFIAVEQRTIRVPADQRSTFPFASPWARRAADLESSAQTAAL
jgi:peptidoglycan/LPS O-acetylase OafA/YrhL